MQSKKNRKPVNKYKINKRSSKRATKQSHMHKTNKQKQKRTSYIRNVRVTYHRMVDVTCFNSHNDLMAENSATTIVLHFWYAEEIRRSCGGEEQEDEEAGRREETRVGDTQEARGRHGPCLLSQVSRLLPPWRLSRLGRHPRQVSSTVQLLCLPDASHGSVGTHDRLDPRSSYSASLTPLTARSAPTAGEIHGAVTLPPWRLSRLGRHPRQMSSTEQLLCLPDASHGSVGTHGRWVPRNSFSASLTPLTARSAPTTGEIHGAVTLPPWRLSRLGRHLRQVKSTEQLLCLPDASHGSVGTHSRWDPRSSYSASLTPLTARSAPTTGEIHGAVTLPPWRLSRFGRDPRQVRSTEQLLCLPDASHGSVGTHGRWDPRSSYSASLTPLTVQSAPTTDEIQWAVTLPPWRLSRLGRHPRQVRSTEQLLCLPDASHGSVVTHGRWVPRSSYSASLTPLTARSSPTAGEFHGAVTLPPWRLSRLGRHPRQVRSTEQLLCLPDASHGSVVTHGRWVPRSSYSASLTPLTARSSPTAGEFHGAVTLPPWRLSRFGRDPRQVRSTEQLLCLPDASHGSVVTHGRWVPRSSYSASLTPLTARSAPTTGEIHGAVTLPPWRLSRLGRHPRQVRSTEQLLYLSGTTTAGLCISCDESWLPCYSDIIIDFNIIYEFQAIVCSLIKVCLYWCMYVCMCYST